MRTRLTLFRLFMLMNALGLAAVASANEGQRFLPQYSGFPQGGIILRYPSVAEPLAHNMGETFTRHGWSVLLAPIKHDLLDPQPAGAIQAQIDYMTGQKGQHNLVVLAIGDAWDPDVSLARTQDEDAPQNPIRGVVLVDVPGDLNAPPELPVLDIVTTRPPAPGFEDRRRQAMKNRMKRQETLALPYVTWHLEQGEDRLTRRIRGFLHHHVKGMELKDIAR